MLAHSGLALISEKHQNKRSVDTTTAFCCSISQVAQGDPLKETCQQHSDLTVTGQNVWTSPSSSDQQESTCQNEVVPTLQPANNSQIPHNYGCPHRKLRLTCQLCDSAQGTPMAPPKKKHCRSLSIPSGSLTVFPAHIREPHGKILKPVAVISHSNNNNTEDSEDKNLLSAAELNEATKRLPKFFGSFKFIPMIPSPPSVDSGHYTMSDLQTPPGSPVPRPASVASDTSFSSLGSAWHDYSPMRSRVVLGNRSLSFDDQISGSSSSSVSCEHGSLEPSSRCSNICHDDSSACDSSGIPRCHSQPCVLHHRRCGKKRRRNCDRPTLNFFKMTETAYTRCHRRSEPWNIPLTDQQLCAALPQIHPDSDRFYLNPIASSPLDAEMPVLVRHLMELDLSHAASAALPPALSGQAPVDSQEHSGCKGQGNEELEDEDGDDDEDCSCHNRQTDDEEGLILLTDLDIEQIESH